MAQTDEELVAMYIHLIGSAQKDAQEANERIAEYSDKLSRAAERVAQKRR